ncbi:MAG TPA: hypothetical protein VIU12_16100, partial [Chryseolinea sp.]
LNASSFEKSAPLGFDGENVTIRLKANNVAGEPINNLPEFTVAFDSCFVWKPNEKGGTLTSKSIAQRDWLGGWRDPSPPWRASWPNSVNNVLVIRTPPMLIRRKIPSQFSRPLKIAAPSDVPLFFREGFDSPMPQEISKRNQGQAIIFDAEGNPVAKPARNSPESTSWVIKATGIDPFSPDRFRVIIKNGTALTLQTVDASRLLKILNLQDKDWIRIDAWLPPHNGRIDLAAPGNRRVFYGSADENSWKRSPDNQISLQSDGKWKRVAFFIQPKSDFKNAANAQVTAQVFW